MITQELIKIIEEIVPLDYAEDFDNVGLLVGDPNREVIGVLVTLDTLEATIEEAVRLQCNFILSFHPIIFNGLKKLTNSTYVERVVRQAIKKDIQIYAIHTALDNSSIGVSMKMAEVLGLKQTKILIPKKGGLKKLTTYVPLAHSEKLRTALFEAGAGKLGNYDSCSFNFEGLGTYRANENANPFLGKIGELHHESENCLSVVFERHLEADILKSLRANHPYEEVAYEIVSLDNTHQGLGLGAIGELESGLTPEKFFELVKEKFGTGTIRHSAVHKDHLKKVAVLGGSGSFGISNAIRAQADVYLTADLKYHDFFRAEGKLLLADIGHYESEQFTKNILVDLLSKKITNFAIILSKINTNPINYF
jgi:dinuclear metal center YbgI/SA1388 family protein